MCEHSGRRREKGGRGSWEGGEGVPRIGSSIGLGFTVMSQMSA